MCWAECVGVQCGGESLPVTTHVQTAKPPQSIHVLGRIEGVHVAAGGWTPWGSGRNVRFAGIAELAIN